MEKDINTMKKVEPTKSPELRFFGWCLPCSKYHQKDEPFLECGECGKKMTVNDRKLMINCSDQKEGFYTYGDTTIYVYSFYPLEAENIKDGNFSSSWDMSKFSFADNQKELMINYTDMKDKR